MTVFLLILTIVILIVITLNLIFWSAWKHKPAKYQIKEDQKQPFVSILIAVRNEVHTLNDTLETLEALDYPKNRYEVLMGDDSSSDGSTKIMQAWDREDNKFYYHHIQHKYDHLQAKANVLAQLAKHAKGTYFLFTDGDALVPESWIKTHLSCWKKGMGIQSGFSIIKAESFFSSMQMIDWALAMGMIKLVSGWRVPVTGVGNNMMVSREAYESVGGYEGIPFSITEDFELFKAIKEKGYLYGQLANPDSLVVKQAEKKPVDLLQQRKRWMQGAMQLPLFMKIILILQALYYPFIVLLLLFNPLLGIPLFGLKSTMQAQFINKILNRLNQYIPIGHMIIFEFYSLVLSVSLLVYYVIPLPIKWKGRKFAKA